MMRTDPRIRVPLYSSNHLVDTSTYYLDGNEIVFNYEAMDVSLRQIASVSSLQAFQIAAVCKEVGTFFGMV